MAKCCTWKSISMFKSDEDDPEVKIEFIEIFK